MTVTGVEIHPVADLDTLLPRADFVIVTTPHTPETEGMWHAQRFRRMKRTAYFINVGRGKTTRLDDLADALEQGIIAGCGLDVFEVEPLPADASPVDPAQCAADAAYCRARRGESPGASVSGLVRQRPPVRGRRAVAQCGG